MRSVMAEWITLGLGISVVVLATRWFSGDMALAGQLLILLAGGGLLAVVQLLFMRGSPRPQSPGAPPEPRADTPPAAPLRTSTAPWAAPARPAPPAPEEQPAAGPPPEGASPEEKMV